MVVKSTVTQAASPGKAKALRRPVGDQGQVSAPPDIDNA
jgi:hypothetical protein